MAWNPVARAQLVSMTVLTLIIVAVFFVKEALKTRRG